MARYTGPRTKIARKFGEPIYGPDKSFEKRNYPPGQHGTSKRRKVKDYGNQLKEKQKVKYMYGVLERQFHNTYDKASRMAGQKGENLILLLESRIDNIVYRLGIAPTRAAARQLVNHKHITLNGKVCSIPSTRVMPGDTVAVREPPVWRLSRTSWPQLPSIHGLSSTQRLLPVSSSICPSGKISPRT